jgi:hypothetical protein
VVAEVIGALSVAKFGHDVGLSHIILEGDSLIVVNTIKENEQNMSRYGRIVKERKVVLYKNGRKMADVRVRQ